jgi:hypothetical protein
MRVRASVVTLNPGTGRITEAVVVDIRELTDADWWKRGDEGDAVHRTIRERIATARPGEILGYALVPSITDAEEETVRGLALLHLDADPECTATKIAEWPEAAKRLILALNAEVHDVERARERGE